MSEPRPIARAALRNAGISAQGGRAAATRPGNGGIDTDESRLGSELRSHANQQGNLQRMAECRRSSLGECRAERAVRVRRPAGIRAALHLIGAGEVAEFVNDSTLLRRQQQQEETQCFVHVSHGVQYHGGFRTYGEKLTKKTAKSSICSWRHRSVRRRHGFDGAANPRKTPWLYIQVRGDSARIRCRANISLDRSIVGNVSRRQ